jgi:hypothetical protein
MTGTIDPAPAVNSGYVVPSPRTTDSFGKALRRAFAPPADSSFTDLLRRLDTIG